MPGFGGGGIVFNAPLTRAEAIAPTRIRATFGNPVRQSDGTLRGDAFDPTNYVLGAVTAGITAPAVVAAIEEVIDGARSLNVAILATLEPLVAGATYSLAAPGVRAVNGAPAATVTIDFLGVGFADPSADPTEELAVGFDIDDSGPDGDFQLGPDGDILLHGGLPVLKKLLERRLTTVMGAFRYLPGYGTGVDLKTLAGAAKLRQVTEEVQRQVLLEPGVAAAETNVTMDAKGILRVRVKARTTRGREFLAQVGG